MKTSIPTRRRRPSSCPAFCRFPVRSLAVLAVLAVASTRAADPTPTPTPVPMPTGKGGNTPDDGHQPFDPNPRDPQSPTNKVMVYGIDHNGNVVPQKRFFAVSSG